MSWESIAPIRRAILAARTCQQKRRRVLRVQIVLAVPAGTAFLHDVLVLEPDDHDEIPVLLDSPLRYRLDGLPSPVVVNREDSADDIRRERPHLRQFGLPRLDAVHSIHSSGVSERSMAEWETERTGHRFGGAK